MGEEFWIVWMNAEHQEKQCETYQLKKCFKKLSKDKRLFFMLFLHVAFIFFMFIAYMLLSYVYLVVFGNFASWVPQHCRLLDRKKVKTFQKKVRNLETM